MSEPVNLHLYQSKYNMGYYQGQFVRSIGSREIVILTLSSAEGEASHDLVILERPSCHPERSEGSQGGVA